MKTQRNWVVEICGRMPRVEVAGEICLKKPRTTQDCTADDDDDDIQQRVFVNFLVRQKARNILTS